MNLRVIFALLISMLCFGLISAQEIPLDTGFGKGYRVGPGDEIVGKVLNESQFDFVATVNEDGKFEVSFSDEPIVAMCKTELEIKKEVTTLLAKYLRVPQLSLQVTGRKSRPAATIYGEVRTPQQIVLTRKATLVEILAFSGGATEEAGGLVQIVRPKPPICTDESEMANWKPDPDDPSGIASKMYSLATLRTAGEETNPTIYPGDVIFVHKAMPVYIMGEVMAPQGVYLKEGGMTLTEAIAKVSGVRQQAKTKDIKVYRLKPGASPESKDRMVISANYDLIRKGEQKDVMLEPYDIIEVDKAKESLAMAIMKVAIGAGKNVIAAGSNSIGSRVLY
jgi:protein involved in polysaccharide export with SLBB domain